MRRVYTLTVKVEAEFKQRIKSTSHKANLVRRIKKALPEPWEVASVTIGTRTIKEKAEPREPTPTELLKAEVLERVRRITDEIREASPTIPRYNLRWYDKGCGDRAGGTAHAHRGQWYVYRKVRNFDPSKPYRSTSRRVRMPRNLICLDNLKGFSNTSDERIAATMCHELTHLSMEASHSTKQFHRAAKRYYERWKALRGL